MEPPLELTWKSKREEQMKLANRRVNKPLVAAAFLFLLWRLRKLGVGISLKNLSLFLLTSLLSLCWFIPGAPKRSVTGAKEIYHFHPYFGHIKWIYRALTECPIEMQVDDAKRSGFQVTELVLFGPTRDLYIYAKADIEHVLKDNWKNYRKNGPDGGFLDYFGELLGRGIFAVDGEEWAAHRKTASFMFSNNALSLKMESSFAHHGELVADFLKEKAKSTEKFNIQEMMQALTFDSISDIAFGVEPGALRSMRDQGKRLEYLAQFDRVQQNITNRFLGPAFVFKLLRFLNLGAEQFIAEDCSKLREYVQEIIEKRKRETKEGRYDLLSLYIDAAEKSTEQAHLKDDDYLSGNTRPANRMPQYWRVAGLSYLQYANVCAEYVRRVLKEPERTKALSRAGYSMIKATWKDGKVASRVTLESALLDDPVRSISAAAAASEKNNS